MGWDMLAEQKVERCRSPFEGHNFQMFQVLWWNCDFQMDICSPELLFNSVAFCGPPQNECGNKEDKSCIRDGAIGNH